MKFLLLLLASVFGAREYQGERCTRNKCEKRGAEDCKTIFIEVDQIKFAIRNEPFTLEEAEDFCCSLGAKLAAINTNQELKHISRHVDCRRSAYIGSWQGNDFRCRFGLIYYGGVISQGLEPFNHGVVCRFDE